MHADGLPGRQVGSVASDATNASWVAPRRGDGTKRQQHPMVVPGAAYYLLTAAGIVVSLGIAATFPLLARITGPEVARNE